MTREIIQIKHEFSKPNEANIILKGVSGHWSLEFEKVIVNEIKINLIVSFECFLFLIFFLSFMGFIAGYPIQFT